MPTLRRGVAATIVVIIGKTKIKYMIENDAIVDVTTKKDFVYHELRVTGTNTLGDCLRGIMNGEVTEIPVSVIKSIKDCGKREFSGVVIG